jgi:hypothetical protein
MECAVGFRFENGGDGAHLPDDSPSWESSNAGSFLTSGRTAAPAEGSSAAKKPVADFLLKVSRFHPGRILSSILLLLALIC